MQRSQLRVVGKLGQYTIYVDEHFKFRESSVTIVGITFAATIIGHGSLIVDTLLNDNGANGNVYLNGYRVPLAEHTHTHNQSATKRILSEMGRITARQKPLKLLFL